MTSAPPGQPLGVTEDPWAPLSSHWVLLRIPWAAPEQPLGVAEDIRYTYHIYAHCIVHCVEESVAMFDDEREH